MPFSAGDKFDHYEMTALIGKGGMGEVYLARDTQLKREVALKFLPPEFVSNSERVMRFQREAEVLASLNHPNIAQIYGVAEEDGVRALVMEFVKGESPSGPMPFEDAWKVMAQVAEGLEYAHERRIVHRDLKPSNLKLTPEGRVKILDFGLAKALSGTPVRAEAAGADSPTLTMGATQAGVVLGTAAYMAPEQIKGREADRRADIWAFGVVLYEMLTANRPFEGKDTTEIMARAVTSEPVLDLAPARVKRLLAECLRKEPEDRLAWIGDARKLLEDEHALVTGGVSGPMRSGFARTAWIAAAIFATIAAGVLAFLHFRESPPELRVVSATLLPPDNAEYDFSAPFALPALSPDGTRVVFGAKGKDGKQQLWVRRLDSPTAQPLPGTENAATPFWDPTSRWVAFGQGTKLKKIDIQGGLPVAITDNPTPLRGGSWSAQGVIVFTAAANGPVMRVAASGGTASPAAPSNEGAARLPWFLPDGRHFLYIITQDGDKPVRVGSLDEPGRPGKVVAQANSNVVYAQGHLLYLRENTLMAQPFNPDRLETTGEAVPVAENIRAFTNPTRHGGFAVSSAGLLVYLTGASGGQSRLVWKDRQGKALGNVGESSMLLGGVEISPDGRKAATSAVPIANGGDIWIYDLARGIPTRFTLDSKTNLDAVWSPPDGATIYFASAGKNSLNLHRKPSNGSGVDELLHDKDSATATESPTSVSPDGKLLLYTRGDLNINGSFVSLWVLPLTGKPEPRPYLQAPNPIRVSRGQFSPDGHWVAYQSNESGQFQIYAAPFPGPGGKRQISSAGGIDPRWRRDGKEIFYVTSDGQLMGAEVAAQNGTLEVGRIQKLFGGIITGRTMTYDAASDGQKFLVVVDQAAVQSAPPLTLLQNWTATLRK